MHAHMRWLDDGLKTGDKPHPRAEVYARYAIEAARRLGVPAPSPYPSVGTPIKTDLAWYEALEREASKKFRADIEGVPVASSEHPDSSVPALQSSNSASPATTPPVLAISEEQRATFKQLRQTFESLAMQSSGLYHVLTESRRLPDAPDDGDSVPPPLDRDAQPSEPRAIVSYEGLPEDPMRPVELTAEEKAAAPAPVEDRQDWYIRDLRGRPLAKWQPEASRHGFMYGDIDALRRFKQIAEAAGNAMLGFSDDAVQRLPVDLRSLCRRGRAVRRRYDFGIVPDSAKTVKWVPRSFEVYVRPFEDGAIVHSEEGRSEVGGDRAAAWMLLVHRLGWAAPAGATLRASRWFWRGRASAALNLAGHPMKFLDGIPTDRFYSVLGSSDRDSIDVCLASAWAIDRLLSMLS